MSNPINELAKIIYVTPQFGNGDPMYIWALSVLSTTDKKKYKDARFVNGEFVFKTHNPDNTITLEAE